MSAMLLQATLQPSSAPLFAASEWINALSGVQWSLLPISSHTLSTYVWTHKEAPEQKYLDHLWTALVLNQLNSSAVESVLPDVQTYKVSPGEYVVPSKHHSNVCHEDILWMSQGKSLHMYALHIKLWAWASLRWLTLIQPMMEVVSAELYCVHSMMEYIKINLCNEAKQS